MEVPTQLTLPLDLDPLAAASGLAQTPGSLLLHGQRAWAGSTSSALLFAPRWILRQSAGQRSHWSGKVPFSSPPPGDSQELLGRLSASWRRRRGTSPLKAFTGLAGILGYELGGTRWKNRRPPLPPFTFPDAWIGAYDCALIFAPGETPHLLVSSLDPLVPEAGGGSWPVHCTVPASRARTALSSMRRQLFDRAAQARAILQEAESRGRQSFPDRPVGDDGRKADHGDGGRSIAPASRVSLPDTVTPHFPDCGWHRRAVEKIHSHLRAGDIYQANLTAFATAETTVRPWSAFAHQASMNPVPFAAYLSTEEAVITSHSPELLLRIEGERVETAPIKGTWAGEEDAWNALQASAKDRAEHLMIVDLARNDLGIHARPGSVEVISFMEKMRLQGLLHMVSRVQAEVPLSKQDLLLDAVFPGGSITGAPKRRAMEIISQLEQCGRGPYTGSIGIFDTSGGACWNIAIRTAVWQEGRVAFGCGGGIVLDSDPGQEYEEAVLKARSFFATLDALSYSETMREPFARLAEPGSNSQAGHRKSTRGGTA